METLGVIVNSVAMGWTGWAKSRGIPSAGATEFYVKFKKKQFSRYSELDHLNIKPLFMLFGRVVHVGETFNRLADFVL